MDSCVSALFVLGITCISVTTGDKILISADTELYMTDTEDNSTTLLYDTLGSVSSIDYHYGKGYLYYTFQNYIMRRNISSNNSSEKPLNLLYTGTVYGLAVDWINHHIYWTNSHGNEIEVADLDGLQRRSIIIPMHFEEIEELANTTLFYDISLDPYEAVMFGIAGDNRGYLKGTLVRAYLNGDQLRSISDAVYKSIITFGIDYTDQRLYVTGTQDQLAFVYSCDYNGARVSEVSSIGTEMWVNPLRVFLDKLYLLHNFKSPGSVVRDRLYRTSLTSYSSNETYYEIDTSGLSHIYDMRIYDEKEQMSMVDFRIYQFNRHSKTQLVTSTTPENIPINSSCKGVAETGTSLVNETHRENRTAEDVQRKGATENMTSSTNIENVTSTVSSKISIPVNYIAVALVLVVLVVLVVILKRHYSGKVRKLFERKRLNSEDGGSMELDNE